MVLWSSWSARRPVKAEVAGSSPVRTASVMSQDIGDSRTYEGGFGCRLFRAFSGGAFGRSGWLVVAAGVEGELPQQLPVFGDYFDVQVVG